MEGIDFLGDFWGFWRHSWGLLEKFWGILGRRRRLRTSIKQRTFTKFKKRAKTGLNCPNKHGSIWSLGHRFQIWCQMWPPRLFGGHSGLKTSFSLLVSNWWKFLIFFSQRTNFSKIPQKISKNLQEILQKSSKISKKSPKNQILHFPPCQPQLY